MTPTPSRHHRVGPPPSRTWELSPRSHRRSDLRTPLLPHATTHSAPLSSRPADREDNMVLSAVQLPLPRQILGHCLATQSFRIIPVEDLVATVPISYHRQCWRLGGPSLSLRTLDGLAATSGW